MTAAMPPDFLGYTLLAAAVLTVVVIGAIAFFAWLGRRLKRRRRDVYVERQGRRDGYVDGDDVAEGLDRLIVDGRIDDVYGDRDRWTP